VALGFAGIVGAALLVLLFLAGLAAKERDNRFCVSCHLHDDKFKRLGAVQPTDLAGLHRQRKHEVGCIACHGGADTGMRLRVWTVAGLDTLKFLAGTYREPVGMRLPLRDRDCRQCHTPILAAYRATPRTAPPTSRSDMGGGVEPTEEPSLAAEAETEGRGGTSYHAIREHDSVDVRCIRCHTAHTTDSDATSRFISKATVTPVCRQCHKQM
jgi:predicted CXXCH cytochrome family protein